MVDKTTSYRLDNLEDTLSLLAKVKCEIIAGGTDMMVRNKSLNRMPAKIGKPVVFINHLNELKQIYRDNNDIHIGASCTYSDLIENPLIPNVLKKAIKQIAAPAIRNRGTIGGNICNASPAGDTLPLLYIFNARILLRSMNGYRMVEIQDFILGPKKVQRLQNEILAEIIFPVGLEEDSYYVFEKISNRKAESIAKISFAGSICLRNDKICDIRFAFGAIGPTIVRSIETEHKLVGKDLPLDDAVIDEIIADFAKLINPIDDHRSTAIYRKTVALNLLRYFLESQGK